MALPILKELLQGYLNSLLNEGIVNDRFNEIVSLEREHRIVQLIQAYFSDVDTSLAELSLYADSPEADFCKLASLAHNIVDKSTSIGAEHMRLACRDLIKACDERNKRSFSRTLAWLKLEFDTTRSKLDAFVQMERRIIRVEGLQPPS